MATYYVSSTASGSGDGSEGNPFALDELDTSKGNIAAGDTVWIKADGAYALTADITMVDAIEDSLIHVEGYSDTIGDGGKPTIDCDAYTFKVGRHTRLQYVDFTLGAAGTGDLYIDNNGIVAFCNVTRLGNTGYNELVRLGRGAVMYGCDILQTGSGAINNAISGSRYASVYYTRLRVPPGTRGLAAGAIIGCSIICTGTPSGSYAGVDFRLGYSQSNANCIGNSIYGFNNGINVSDKGPTPKVGQIVNNVVWGCLTYGLQFDDTPWGTHMVVDNNFIGGCASGRTDGVPANWETNGVTLTQDPFVDAVNGDMRLNDAAGGGRLCKFAGFEAPTS